MPKKRAHTIDEEVVKLMKKHNVRLFISIEFPKHFRVPWIGKVAVKVLDRLGAVPKVSFIKQNVENTR